MKRAMIAMSGGVDSSVAAYLMQQAGYACCGVTMRLFYNEDVGAEVFSKCCGADDVRDAALAAERLGMPHRAVSFSEAFREQVIGKFIRVYESGGTPNPCIDCNRYLKFDLLLRYALEQGMDVVATGHYARTEQDETGRWHLKKAVDPSKDQSYVLYTLTQAQLEHIRFPLGGQTKAETRILAERLGLTNANKPDSQDICFVPDGDYAAFLERTRGADYPPGAFLDAEGREVGRHRGAVRYTVGQRRGLGLPAGERLYVVKKDMARNTVTVGPERLLYANTVEVGDLNWIPFDRLESPIRAAAKLRYRMTEQPCTIEPVEENRVRLRFDEPQRAPTPGQSAVFYRGDEVLGGGTIG